VPFLIVVAILVVLSALYLLRQFADRALVTEDAADTTSSPEPAELRRAA
jgi:hypothetical protein